MALVEAPRSSASTSIRSSSTRDWAQHLLGQPRRRRLAEAQLEAKLNMPLGELKLSVRANNCLESEEIKTVRDLVQRNEDQLLEVRNFGETTLNEVREKLAVLACTWECGCRQPARVKRGKCDNGEPRIARSYSSPSRSTYVGSWHRDRGVESAG